jgi:hypothetical protein
LARLLSANLPTLRVGIATVHGHADHWCCNIEESNELIDKSP